MAELQFSPAPHIKSATTHKTIIRDVIVSLLPAVIGSVIFFSFRALVILALSVISCVFFEVLYNRLMRKEETIGDMTAVVTGILLGFSVPVAAPVWLVVIAAAFSIVVVKMLYGGLGKNITNPAISGRIFIAVLFSGYMTKFVHADGALDHTAKALPLFANVGADVVSCATPLEYLKNANPSIIKDIPLANTVIGNVGGCIGETSAILLIIGGCYLLYKRVITWHIPVAFISTVALITFLFPATTVIPAIQFMFYNVFSGGLMLGAIFMATDYTTSPITPMGKIIYGIGCGVITVLIRYFGSYSEGVAFAILIMNLFTWFIDERTTPSRFGSRDKLYKLFKKKGGAK